MPTVNWSHREYCGSELQEEKTGSAQESWESGGSERVLRVKVLTKRQFVRVTPSPEDYWITSRDNVMVSQTVAVQLPCETDSQRTFPKPSATVGMQEEHCGLPCRSGYDTVLCVFLLSNQQSFHHFNTTVSPLICQHTFQAHRSITAACHRHLNHLWPILNSC